MKKNKLQAFYNKKGKVYNFSITPGSLYEKIFNRINAKSIVLDIGCANGNFSKNLKKIGCKVYGIEVSDEMGTKARKVLDEVVIGNVEDIRLEWKKKTFDVILLMDVLEHLFEPSSTLTKLKQYLKSEGRIIVSLPNIANWEIRRDLLFGKFNYQRTGILETGHIRFFTFQNALKMFREAGFLVNDVDAVVNLPLFLLKVQNKLPLLKIDKLLKTKFPNLFAYQFIFELRNKK